MTSHLATAASVAFFMALGGAALAQESSRFQFEKIPDGYVRLETQTGKISVCKGAGNEFSCRLAPDERAALNEEISRLHEENAALRRQLARQDTPSEPNQSLKLPTEKDVDEALSWAEQMMRKAYRFIHRMLDLSQEDKV